MRKLLLAVLVGLALVAGQAQAVNKSYVIQSNVQIGSFNLRTDPTLQGAIAIFGAPTRLAKTGTVSCEGRWTEHRITISFYNLGGQDSCKPQYGNFGSAVMTGQQWRTAKGLRIGDTRYKMQSLYRPRHYSGQWATLLSEIRRFDCSLPRGCLYRKLEAKIMDGRVVAFRVNYTAGGV